MGETDRSARTHPPACTYRPSRPRSTLQHGGHPDVHQEQFVDVRDHGAASGDRPSRSVINHQRAPGFLFLLASNRSVARRYSHLLAGWSNFRIGSESIQFSLTKSVGQSSRFFLPWANDSSGSYVSSVNDPIVSTTAALLCLKDRHA